MKHTSDIWSEMTDDEKLKLLWWTLDTKNKIFNEIVDHDASGFKNFDLVEWILGSNDKLEELPQRCQDWFNTMVEEESSGH